MVAWTLPVLIGVGGWIGMLWVFRPQWGMCADSPDPELSFCDTGVHSLGAVVGTIGLSVLLLAYVQLAVVLRGPARRVVLSTAIVLIGLACVIFAGLEVFVIHEPIPPHIGG